MAAHDMSVRRLKTGRRQTRAAPSNPGTETPAGTNDKDAWVSLRRRCSGTEGKSVGYRNAKGGAPSAVCVNNQMNRTAIHTFFRSRGRRAFKFSYRCGQAFGTGRDLHRGTATLKPKTNSAEFMSASQILSATQKTTVRAQKEILSLNTPVTAERRRGSVQEPKATRHRPTRRAPAQAKSGESP